MFINCNVQKTNRPFYEEENTRLIDICQSQISYVKKICKNTLTIDTCLLLDRFIKLFVQEFEQRTDHVNFSFSHKRSKCSNKIYILVILHIKLSFSGNVNTFTHSLDTKKRYKIDWVIKKKSKEKIWWIQTPIKKRSTSNIIR